MNISQLQNPSLDIFVNDLVYEITKYLDVKSIKNLSETSKRYYEIFDYMLSSSNQATNCAIRSIFRKGAQKELFKVFRRTYHLTSSLRIEDTTFSKKLSVNPENITSLRNCFPKIAKFSFRYTNIDNKGLDTLVKVFSNIESLDLIGCKNITRKGYIDGLGSCRSLKTIYLSDKNIEDQILRVLVEKNRRLQKIGLVACQNISNTELMRSFSSCNTLQEIHFSRMKIDNDALQSILEANRGVKTLSLYRCKTLTGEGLFKSLSLCNTIKEIDLSDTHINDKGLKALVTANPHLETLYLHSCCGVTKKGFFESFSFCHSLRQIELANTHISDEGLFALLKRNLSLEELSLSSCDEITKEGLLSSAPVCKSLKLVDLTNSNICDEGLFALLKANSQIETINLRGSQEISHMGLCQSFSLCKSLKFINLSYTNIDDRALQTLVEKNKQLETLNINHCTRLTKKGFLQFFALCQSLRYVYVDFFDSQMVQVMHDLNPQVHIIN